MIWGKGFGLFLALILVVLFFVLRETHLYKKAKKSRDEIYPYPLKRLFRRYVIFLCILGEIVLLFWGPSQFLAYRPHWLFGYVALVGFLVGIMVFLAFLDFRESAKIHLQNQNQIFKEFLQNLQSSNSSSKNDNPS